VTGIPEAHRETTPAMTPMMATATFLMTDIAGSTRLWEQEAATMPTALAAHDAILRAAIEGHGGVVIKTTGDGMLARFDDAADAVAAALELQRALAVHAWEISAPLRVRVALHAGGAHAREGDFFGPALNRLARLLALGHGGQILLSGVAAALARDRLTDVGLRDLGEHRLRDLEQTEHVFQLTAPDLPADFPPLRSTGSSRVNLPTQLTSFVGRERELADLAGLLPTARLVTLIGVGGTGKTRLMIQAAATVSDRYPDGVAMVELAPVNDSRLILAEVARVLGVREEPGRPLLDSIVDYLRYKDLLLLIDNCEHVISAVAAAVEDLLEACPSLHVLTSSREALGVAGEAVYQVPSLAVPQALDPQPGHGGPTNPGAASSRLDEASLAGLANVGSVRLFVDRAAAGSPGFTLTSANAAAVVEICRRLDGIPLAIELAAARIVVLSPGEIAQRLGDRFRLLTGGRRTAVPRQQTLQALIDWSWDLLTEPDRRLLRRLSVFAGGWTLAAATATADDEPSDTLETLDGLERLAARSLISVEQGQATRYRMLETIRQYAGDRLVASGEAPEIRARHLAFFLDLARAGGPGLRGPQMLEWLERLDADADNLRAALDWAFESDPEAALWFCVAMRYYWPMRTDGGESADRMRLAVSTLRGLPPPPAEAARERAVLSSEILSEAAQALIVMGEGDAAAAAWAEEALAIARTLGETETLVRAFEAQGVSLAFRGEREKIIGFSDEAALAATQVSAWVTLAYLRAGLGMMAVYSGDSADELFEQAAQEAVRSGNPGAIAFVAVSRAAMLGWTGRLAEARAQFLTGYAILTEIGDKRAALAARSDMAHAIRRAGELDQAEAIYRETIRGWERLGSRGAIAHQLESFAYMAVARGQLLRAAELLAAAEALRAKAGSGMLVFERRELDEARAAILSGVSSPELDAAERRGRGLNPEQAVTLALGE
jgi:predicted ATPase/class 3 adenylate cyclase